MNQADTAAPTEHLVTRPFDFVPGGAIFDCDGTLADTMPLHYQAWRDTLEPTGCPFPEDLFYAWGGVTAHEIAVRLNEKYNCTLDPDATAHAKEETYRLLIPQVGPVPAIVAEVQRLHGRCPLAVASGGMRIVVEETLTILGLSSYFNAIITAEDYRHGKPAPDIFLLAAERLGVPPDTCIVYEDSPAGLLAAHRAGMRAVDVRPYYAAKQEPAASSVK